MVMDKILFKSKVDEGNITIERKSHLSERILNYLKELCTGCGMCVEVCPEDCIVLNPPSTKGARPIIVIDAEKCFFCGQCSEVCLFNAIDVKTNGKSVKDLEGTPRYSLTYEINLDKCPPDCNECEKVCPRGALKFINGEGIARDEKRCVYCKTCSTACPEDAIIVEKVFSGDISIDSENCQACGVCEDICPSKAIVFPKMGPDEEAQRIKLIEEKCIYCGACEKACPTGVIKVSRKNASYSVKNRRPWTKKHEEAFRKIVG